MKNSHWVRGSFPRVLIARNRQKILGIFILLMLFQPVFGAGGYTIVATGSWTNPIHSANLVSGAGSDLENTYQSDANATTLSIIDGPKDGAWQVYISRADMNWPVNFTLSVKRTGAGSGTEGKTVRGGLPFQTVNAAKTLFFTGIGPVLHIPVQYQLSGVSLRTSPNVFNTGVTFTVIP